MLSNLAILPPLLIKTNLNMYHTGIRRIKRPNYFLDKNRFYNTLNSDLVLCRPLWFSFPYLAAAKICWLDVRSWCVYRKILWVYRQTNHKALLLIILFIYLLFISIFGCGNMLLLLCIVLDHSFFTFLQKRNNLLLTMDHFHRIQLVS